MDQIIQVFFNGAVLERAWPYLVRGVEMTALLSLVIVPIGIASGLAVAMLYHLHVRWLNWFLRAYVDFFRAFPPLVLLLFIYGGLL
jgi:polar amino acid transport system permease protein